MNGTEQKLVEACLLFVETNDSRIKSQIIEKLNFQLNKRPLNTIDVYEKYRYLKDNLESLDKVRIEADIIDVEHKLEYETLNWIFSFILRWFK